MKGSGGRLALALAIPLLVAPLAGLTWLAARSVDQQESGMRARLRESLLLEVAQTNARIGAWFAELPEELRASAPRAGTAGKPTARELADWKKRNPLVGIPFLLDASGSIVYPKPHEESRLFYWRYLNVFSNAERIPVYRNIASEYETSIVGPEAVTRAAPKDRQKSAAPNDDAVAATPSAAQPDAQTAAQTAAPTAALPEVQQEIQPEVLQEVQAIKSEEAQVEALETAKADAASAKISRAEAPRAEAPRAALRDNLAETDSAVTDSAEPSAELSGAYMPGADMPSANGPSLAMSEAPSVAPGATPSAESEQAKPAKRSMPGFSAKKKEAAPSPDASAVRSNIAQSIFKTDSAVQKQVYALAAEEGKETLTRNVNPQIDASNTRDSAPARSVYIESDRYFRDLVSQADRGLVPRIFDNSFVLLYWEKRGDWIVGCELDMDAVREAIAARSGTPADGLRYLAVLDQSGAPLVPVAGMEAAAWRTPLVSGEISEFLPYWETAVILSDPSAFESRVRASRYALSALVFALFLSVAGGAVFLWRYSSARLLEAKRRTGFVTTVSHELKTPLTSIRMYSEMLANGADLDRTKRDRYLAQIVSESERLTHLINDVLDVAKLERGKRRLARVPVDIALVARETALGIADRLKAAGFSVTFRAGDSPAIAMADKDAVVRILLNLLSNAEKYSGDGREIEVTVGFDEKRAWCLASVADRGIGVPRTHRKKIFREFHRVDATLTSGQGGTGLGLSIARALARSLGGDIFYAPRDRSGREKGSVFTLKLPAAGQKDGNQ